MLWQQRIYGRSFSRSRSQFIELAQVRRPCYSEINKNKLRLNSGLTYVGQLFTWEGLKPYPMKVEAIATMLRPDDKRAD